MEKEKKENKEGCYGSFLCEWLCRGFGFRTMMELLGLCELNSMVWKR